MSTNPYSNPYASSKREIDLRKELEDTLYGTSNEISKGVKGLLRKMRRNSSGVLQRCACRDILTDEPDLDSYCRYCLGHGYYWDEIPITYYRNSTPFGRQEENTREYLSHIFYLEYDVPVTSDDYIVSVRLDTEGNVIIPVVRDSYYRILSADPYRGENGRIEFFAVRAVEEREWSVNYGVRNRQVS